MSRRRIDPVDRILDAWDAASKSQREEALRTIRRLEVRAAEPAIAEAPRRRGRPRKEVAPEVNPQ